MQARILPTILYFQTMMKHIQDKKAAVGFQDSQGQDVVLAENINIRHAAIQMQDE